jgi:alkylresorcinol/alkylpyrone synthase
MFFTGVGTAVPARRYSKAECWDAYQSSEWYRRLSPRAHAVVKTVLQRDNGIEHRHLALDTLDEVFRIDPDTLHSRFRTHAPALARKSGLEAIERSGIARDAIDAVVVSTCTGYLCPGLSSYVIEQIGLRADVQAYDLVGQGCGAALPNMRLAQSLLASGACEHVLSICVEVCSAAMYLDDDPGVLISACLFGDGAGAAVLSRQPGAGRRVEWKDGESLSNAECRASLMFEQRGGLLRNILAKEVPMVAADHARRVLGTVLERNGMARGGISCWIMHAGGRDVLLALEKGCGIGKEELRYSRAMLRDYGNLSSAFVYFVLRAALADDAPGGTWWMSAFGAGFSCHGALLKVD